MTKRRRVHSRPFWANQRPKNIARPSAGGSSWPSTGVPGVGHAKAELHPNTIGVITNAIDCCVQKMILEYIPYFDKDGFAVMNFPEHDPKDIVQLAPQYVILFRSGIAEKTPPQIIRNLETTVQHFRQFQVRTLYYIDDYLVHMNKGAPTFLAGLCDAIVVPNETLYDYFVVQCRVPQEVHIVRTHIDLKTFDGIKPFDFLKPDKFKILMSSQGRLGALGTRSICAHMNNYPEKYKNVQLVINANGVAQIRTILNEFRNVDKFYMDWLTYTDYYALAKSVNLQLYPAIPQDLEYMVEEKHRQVWLDSKSELKYTLAGAARIPILASRTASYVASIRHGETGFLASEIDEFIDIIDDLKDNPEKCKQIGEAARKDMEENYDISVRYPTYRDVITGTIQSQRIQKSSPPGAQPQSDMSIVVASYNYANLIGETLESCLTQTWKPKDIIVVDDGSTDNSVEVIKQFPVTLIEIPHANTWGEGALNAGIAQATGKYITTIAADDIYYPDYIEKVQPLFTEGVGLVRVGAFKFGDESGLWTSPIITDPLIAPLVTNICLGSSAFLRECWEKLGGFDENTSFGDWDMWIKIIHAGYKLATTNDPLYKYRIHNKSITRSHDMQVQMLYLAKKYRKLLDQYNVTTGALASALQDERRGL